MEREAAALFVSYAREDHAAVRAVVEALARRRVPTWVDVERIDFASRWRDEIEAALSRAPLVLAFVSADSAQSAACRLEWEQAHSLGKRVLPVILQSLTDGEVPAALADHQWLRVADFGSEAEAIAAAVQASLQTDPERLREHTDITARAVAWALRGRGRDGLLRGAELLAALQWNRPPALDRAGMRPGDASTRSSLRLGELAHGFVLASQADAVRRKALLGATLLATALLLLAAAGAAWLSRQEAAIQRLYSLRGQLAVLAGDFNAAGIVETVDQPEVQELAARDPIAVLYARLAATDDLVRVRTDGLNAIDWIAVRGHWLLASMRFGDDLIDVRTGEALPPPAPLEDASETRIVVSPAGRFAAYSGRQLAVVVDLETAGPAFQVALPAGSELVDVDDSGAYGWLQHGRHCVAVRFLRDAPSRGDLLTMHRYPDCEFVKRLNDRHALLRRRAGASPEAFAYAVVDPGVEQALSTGWGVGLLDGPLHAVLASRIDTLVLWIGRTARVIDLPGPDDPPAALETKRRLLLPDSTVSLALAHEVDRLAVLDADGSVKVAAVARPDPRPVASGSASALGDHGTGGPLRDLDAAQRIRAIRMDGVAYGAERIVFDIDDQRLFSGGPKPLVRDGLDGLPLARISAAADVTVVTGTVAESLFVSADGSHLVGAVGIHGGRGQMNVVSMRIPPRLGVFRTQASAIGWLGAADTLLVAAGGVIERHALASGQQATTELENPPEASGGAFSADGRQLVLASEGATVTAWNAETGRQSWSVTLDPDPENDWNAFMPLSVHRRGDRILAVTRYKAWLLSAADGRTLCGFDRVEDLHTGMASFFRDDYVVAVSMSMTNGTGWQNRTLTIRSASDCSVVLEGPSFLNEPGEARILTTGFGLSVRLDTAGYGWLVEPEGGDSSRVVDLQEDRTVAYLTDETAVLALVPWPERAVVATAGWSGSVRLWDAQTWRSIRRLPVGNCPVTQVQPSPSSRWLLAACADGTAQVWDLGEPAPPRTSFGPAQIPRPSVRAGREPGRWKPLVPVRPEAPPAGAASEAGR